jgi:hypothetical protein
MLLHPSPKTRQRHSWNTTQLRRLSISLWGRRCTQWLHCQKRSQQRTALCRSRFRGPARPRTCPVRSRRTMKLRSASTCRRGSRRCTLMLRGRVSRQSAPRDSSSTKWRPPPSRCRRRNHPCRSKPRGPWCSRSAPRDNRCTMKLHSASTCPLDTAQSKQKWADCWSLRSSPRDNRRTTGNCHTALRGTLCGRRRGAGSCSKKDFSLHLGNHRIPSDHQFP